MRGSSLEIRRYNENEQDEGNFTKRDRFYEEKLIEKMG